MNTSEAGFTEGPWTLVQGEEGWRVFGTSPGGREGCYSVAEVIDGNGFSQNKANAHLIAAAPDLLHAVQAVYMDSVGIGHGENAISDATREKVHAAIAKALGA